ncbi:MAG: hypothetical protein K6T73_07860 [Candidatus Bathyarchaeota archaeon]|nr:hypothetical protein [Candidatus Bathyarchaeota archaeon]
MRYQKSGRQSYEEHKRKIWVPRDIKSKFDRRLYELVRLKPAGEWSRDLVESTEAGKILAETHWKNVKKALKKEKPSTKAQLEAVLKKAVMTPQQKLVILYEKSLRMPLSTEEFQQYLTLFQENFPEAYKSMYDKKSPSEIVAQNLQQMKKVS